MQLAFRAGLYEHRIVVGRWLTSSDDSIAHWNGDAARRDDTGRRFWVFVTRAFTFSYFIPTMVRLMRAPDSPESVAVAMRWRNLNYLRHAIVLAAWLMSLRAFASLYRS
ncbi:MAG: hypothetical protein AUH75_09195 [Gemmatimonadetes bacterium 13_1_40CM_4_65_7]|nr:MAG: hypothetical protein AUH75_09195 [Gemmatimonadetes bacterium 13_1_40CM_4_65_7]